MTHLQERFALIQTRFTRIQELMGSRHHRRLMMEAGIKGVSAPPEMEAEGEPVELLPAIAAFNSASSSEERIKAMGMLENLYIAAKKRMRDSEEPGCHMVADPYSSAYGEIVEDEQKERHADFSELAGRFGLSTKSMAKILGYRAETISRFLSGKSPIPAAALSTLRRVVTAIEGAR